ncbi:MAG: CHRD domain-containing protein [Phycisphaerae bacterium]
MRRIPVLAAIAALAAIALPAQAELLEYTASLSGPAEEPPNASPGTGIALVDIDTVALTVRVQASFSGLIGNVTNAHIHAATAVPGAGTAGVATTTPTFPGFPGGGTSGAYDMTFDMTLASSFNASYVTANGGTVDSARAALFSAIDTGRAYFNIHSTTFGGGEIRGFLTPVPEPTTLALFALSGVALLARRR